MHDNFEDMPRINICSSSNELCKMHIDDDAFWESFLPERVEGEDWAVPINTKDGATCIKCLEFYPYAQPKDLKTFKCWGCRHF